MVQALRSVFPSPSAFVEEDSRWDFSLEPDEIHYRIQLRCVACPQPVEPVHIEPESVSYSSITDRHEAFSLQFRTKSPSNGSEWRVLGQIEKLQFAVASKKSYAPGAAVNPNFFEPLACGGRKNCRGATVFDTHTEATAFASGLKGLVARRAVIAGKPIAAVDLTSPILVRKGSEVHLSMVAESGLSLRARAIALESGTAGERIRIKLQSGTWDKSLPQSHNLVGRVNSADEVIYEK